MIRILRGRRAEAYVRELEERRGRLGSVLPAVESVVQAVRRRGDRALVKYARRWDGLAPAQPLKVSNSELSTAWKRAPRELQAALEVAARNIRRFSEWQKPREWSRRSTAGRMGQMVIPLASVGCYVPGGRFPLVSTLLMTVIPAQVAGVRNLQVVSPQPAPEMLAAAYMLGIQEFYRVGGAQAIAALAYGTETIRPVDKIVGPGNLYVTASKKLVSVDCAIDTLAGPTEVVIVRSTGNPLFIAADLIAQAEHDPETLAVFITTSLKLAQAVEKAVRSGDAMRSEGRHPIARQSLARRGALLLASSTREAFAWANRIAPEHLAIEKRNLHRVVNAGSVFLGDYSAQAAGDYVSGPNHVLPTSGAARLRGGLSVADFVKLISVQELSHQDLKRVAPAAVLLAETEGLRAHAESIKVRCAGA